VVVTTIYVPRFGGTLILQITPPAPPSPNAQMQARKGNAQMQARRGAATFYGRKP